jgi:hypothetical protein
MIRFFFSNSKRILFFAEQQITLIIVKYIKAKYSISLEKKFELIQPLFLKNKMGQREIYLFL